MEDFPNRTEKTRKRIQNTMTWSRNVSKKKVHGENYVSRKEKLMPETLFLTHHSCQLVDVNLRNIFI